MNNTFWGLSAGASLTGIASVGSTRAGVASSAVVPVRGGSGRRCILAGDRPNRRSVACSLHRGLGESALLCLFEARLVRAGGDGGGDGAGVGGGPGSLRARTAEDGGSAGPTGSGFGVIRRFWYSAYLCWVGVFMLNLMERYQKPLFSKSSLYGH